LENWSCRKPRLHKADRQNTCPKIAFFLLSHFTIKTWKSGMYVWHSKIFIVISVRKITGKTKSVKLTWYYHRWNSIKISGGANIININVSGGAWHTFGGLIPLSPPPRFPLMGTTWNKNYRRFRCRLSWTLSIAFRILK